MPAWSRAACAAVGLWACALAAQPVYKWVDAEGKTHYGSQPPQTQPDAAPLKITPNGGSGGSPSGAGYNPDGTKKVPKEVRDMEAGLAKGLQKVDPKEVPLNCSAAVSNVHDQADTMLEVGQRNLKDGYMTQAQFDATAAKIRQNRAETTLGDCQSATGAKKAFYQCMSNSYNHIMGCSQKHRP